MSGSPRYLGVSLAGERAKAFEGERRRRIAERRRREEERRVAGQAAHAARLAAERERLSGRLVALARRTEALAGIRVTGPAEDERQGVLRTLAVLGTRLARAANQGDADNVHVDLISAAGRLEAVRAGLAASLAEEERLAALTLVEGRLAEWDHRVALDADGAQAVADQLAVVGAGTADARAFRFGYARLNELVGDHLTLVARRTTLLAEAAAHAEEAGEALAAVRAEAADYDVALPGSGDAEEIRDLLAVHLAAGRFQEAAHGAARLAAAVLALEQALDEQLDRRDLIRHVTEAAAHAGLKIVEADPIEPGAGEPSLAPPMERGPIGRGPIETGRPPAARLAYLGELTPDVLTRLRENGAEPG